MKYFIFDVDGTLIDSAPVDQVCLQQTMREFGREYTLEELRFSFGLPGRQTLAVLGIPPEQADAVMARWEGLSQQRIDEVRAFAGIEDMLKALHAADCRCGVVTSRTRWQIEYGFTPGGLDHYFDAIVSAEDAPRTKPAPDPLLDCLRRMGGMAADAVYIGDSAGDMQCAAAAGVASALALWGCPAPEKISSDIRFARPADILSLVK